MNLWINVVMFQIGWFACVLGGARGMPGIGAAVALAVVALHLFLAPQPKFELVLVLFAAALGIVADTLLIRGGWLTFDSGVIFSGVAPYWMVALWMNFATTINVSLHWLKQRPLLAIAFGALGGPLAYFAGAKLGAVTMSNPAAALAAVGVVWALAMPLLLIIADRFNGTLHRNRVPGASCV